MQTFLILSNLLILMPSLLCRLQTFIWRQKLLLQKEYNIFGNSYRSPTVSLMLCWVPGNPHEKWPLTPRCSFWSQALMCSSVQGSSPAPPDLQSEDSRPKTGYSLFTANSRLGSFAPGTRYLLLTKSLVLISKMSRKMLRIFLEEFICFSSLPELFKAVGWCCRNQAVGTSGQEVFMVIQLSLVPGPLRRGSSQNGVLSAAPPEVCPKWEFQE